MEKLEFISVNTRGLNCIEKRTKFYDWFRDIKIDIIFLVNGLVGRWARKPVNHTSWVAVVTPTDRPKSVRNRCLIELFCGVVCVVTLPF